MLFILFLPSLLHILIPDHPVCFCLGQARIRLIVFFQGMQSITTLGHSCSLRVKSFTFKRTEEGSGCIRCRNKQTSRTKQRYEKKNTNPNHLLARTTAHRIVVKKAITTSAFCLLIVIDLRNSRLEKKQSSDTKHVLIVRECGVCVWVVLCWE